MTSESKKNVSVEAQAAIAMILHAVKHKHEVVHGLLLGAISGGTIQVKDAVAVCHGVPTKPLVEAAIGLVQAQSKDTIVGWYTAPELLLDTKPGPVALRMAANLETEQVNSTLIVIQNEALAACLKEEGKLQDVFVANGKDALGSQWTESLKCTVKDESSSTVVKQAQEEIKSGKITNDFMDHLEGEPSSPWYPR